MAQVNDPKIIESIADHQVRLRSLTLADADFILTLVNQPDFLHFIGDKQVRTLDDAKGYLLNGPIASYQQHGFGLMALTLLNEQQGEQLIGMCGLLKRTELPCPDLGYAILPTYYRQGFSFQACQLLLSYYRQPVNFSRLHKLYSVDSANSLAPEVKIQALTSPDNNASMALLIKLGFQQCQVETLNGQDSVIFDYFLKPLP